MLVVMLVSLLASASCQAPPNAEPDAVSVQLKWVHQAQFAGFYVAQEAGYYADENLDVTFVPSGPGIDLFQRACDGEADFAIVGADSLLAFYPEHTNLRAIATIYRINPFVLVAWADSGINTPADFAGKTLIIADSYDRVQLAAMLQPYELTLDDMTIEPYTTTSIDDFVAGEADIISSYAAGSLTPLREAAGERELTLIWPNDFGVNFYADTIVTCDEHIENQPDMVLRFLRATLKGHDTATEDSQQAIDATMRYADIQDRDVQTTMFNASAPLIHTGEARIGWMEMQVWQKMHETMLEQGVLEAPLDLDAIIDTQFLETIYGDLAP
jgi:NitT/TauT family transport system substrate-binding protein